MTRRQHADDTGPPAEQPEEEFVTFEQLIGFLRSHLFRILLVAAAAGLAAALALVLLVRPRYETWATVIVATATTRELPIPALGARGYQRILESGAVVQDTERRLKQEGALAETGELALGRDLRTRVFTGPRAGSLPTAPIIELVARAEDPDAAAGIANTWVQVFLDRLGKVTAETISGQILVVEGQYQRVREDLEALELERQAQAVRFQDRLERSSERWRREILDHRQRTRELVAEHQDGTRRLFAQAVAQSAAAPSAPPELPALVARLRAFRERLAITPQILFVQTTVNQATFGVVDVPPRGESQPGPAVGRELTRQEPSPIYEALSLQAAEVEAQVRAETGGSFESLVRRLEELQTERTVGLTKLIGERAAELMALRNEERRELQAIAEDEGLASARRARSLERKQELFEQVSADLEAASLSSGEQDLLAVRLVSEAVAPGEPIPRHLLLKTGAAVFFGTLLGLIWALGLERARSRSDGS